MELRPYQKEAVNAVMDDFKKFNKCLLVLPTGCGKTIVFSTIVKILVDKGQRVLILAHRSELLQQAADKLKTATGVDSVLEKADATALGSFMPVTVGSVQTLQSQKRLERFSPDYYDAIIIDEAHHALSKSYQNVLDYFSSAKVLGVTATPDRGDKKSLGTLFENLSYEYTLPRAIRDGYLVNINAQTIPLDIDISSVKISQGDYQLGDIGNALEPYLDAIAQEMAQRCTNRKTVVFLPLVATSKRFCELLNTYGLNACEVNGNSSDREKVLADFEAGRYNVICNSMLLTEGWDCPTVDTVVVLRPTKVRALYAQMIGRGTRLAPGKDHMLILDFLWHTTNHNLCKPTCLISKDAEVAERADKIIDLNPQLEFSIEDVLEQAEKDVKREREEALARQLAELKKRKRREFNVLEFMYSIKSNDIAEYQPVQLWEMEDPTQKQLDALEKVGVDVTGLDMCRGLAAKILDICSSRREAGLCTPKQLKHLERYGYPNASNYSFSEASAIMTQLANARWRVANLATQWRPENYTPEVRTFDAFESEALPW